MNSKHIREQVVHLNREVGEKNLVVVTKHSTLEEMEFVYQLGCRDFGESRVQVLREKADYFQKKQFNDLNWHFIGPIQSNKVKQLLKTPNLSYIHSIGSLKVLKELVKQFKFFGGKVLNLFFQCNTTGEVEKSGFKDFESLMENLEYFDSIKNQCLGLRFVGLMTMGKATDSNFEEEARKAFKKLVEWGRFMMTKKKMGKIKYSMGMSKDYKIALEEGSDFIRVGSVIFKKYID